MLVFVPRACDRDCIGCFWFENDFYNKCMGGRLRDFKEAFDELKREGLIVNISND